MPLGAAEATRKDFEGKDAVVFKALPNVIHAIKNTGGLPLTLVSFSNKRHDPQNPDTFRQSILK
jgi:hypothetical protein